MVTLLLTILGWMAVSGAVILIFQLILMVFGFDSAHTDIDINADMTDTSTNVDSHDGGVRIFSLLGISTFLLIFGLAGRYFIITVALEWSLALLISFAIALFMMYVVGWIFLKAKKLESDGTVQIKDALNCVGTVYLPFHTDLVGTVQINVNGIMHEFDAMAQNDKDNFKVGDSVKVTEVQGNFVKVILNKNS